MIRTNLHSDRSEACADVAFGFANTASADIRSNGESVMVTNDKAAKYRRHAADARALAPCVTSETDKECLLAAAYNYDKLAVLAEQPGREHVDQSSTEIVPQRWRCLS
jgi:hypothetical protein